MINDYYDITVPAVADPVLLSEVKNWCRITGTSEDAILTGLITATTVRLESYTNRVFSTRTYKGYFSGLSCSRYEKGPVITLRRSPLISVTSVSVGGEVIDPTTYEIRQTSGFSRIVFHEIPIHERDEPYPIEVVFTAGYATVPEDIKIAIKQYVDLDLQGSIEHKIVPKNIKSMVGHYRTLGMS
jgi:uncharacterized phiE125 gp8 family phage protein